MAHATPMLNTHPAAGAAVDVDTLANFLHELEECAQSCTLCADACLAEDMVADLRRCIRLNLDCAALCRATAEVVGRQVEPDVSVLRATIEACAAACAACGNECGSHADMHEHCRICAEACRRCEQACRDALSALG